jgi:DNA repair exonuclease SbcCD ATPase subunit
LIEQAMIFALGFLVAALFGLLFLPAVQRRAARLAGRRLEMLLPLSMEEIVAERDQLRAEFAVERRRIEQKLEAAGDAQAQHMGEIGRQAGMIDDLNGQLSQTREELRALGEGRDGLQREMDEAQVALGALQKALEDENASHAEMRETLEGARAEHAALDQPANEQRAALAALEMRAAALDLRIVALNHQREDLEKNLQAKASEAEVLQVERDLARAERDGLEVKRATLQRRLEEEALQTADLRDQIETLRRRVEEADRTRVAGEQARDAAQQRHDAAVRKVEEQENRIRALQSAAAERHATQVAEIATLTGPLESARRMQQERRAQKQQEARPAEDGGAEQSHAETALVRQAIADLGAEVLKIAESLKPSRPGSEERDDSPPEVMGRSQSRNRARLQP